jgi:hypothetical protein
LVRPLVWISSALACALVLVLGSGLVAFIATATAESSGDWQITTKVDSVTGAKILNVRLEARKTAHDGLFLPPDALLQLGCLKNHPLIHVTFAFQIGSKGDSEISYRFDNQPAQPIEARILRGLRIMVIEDKNEVAKFIDGLATANALYHVISSLDKGRTSAEFRVAGAQAPIEWVTANCGPNARKM